jgi:hypothetical protein
LLRRLDEVYSEYPFYGSRRMLAVLRRNFAYQINRKRIQRLMSVLELAAIYPQPKLANPLQVTTCIPICCGAWRSSESSLKQQYHLYRSAGGQATFSNVAVYERQ